MIDEATVPPVPDAVKQVARDFVAGKEVTATDMHELQSMISTATWSALVKLRATSQAAPSIAACLAARGPEHTSEEKLDAIITLLSMGK